MAMHFIVSLNQETNNITPKIGGLNPIVRSKYWRRGVEYDISIFFVFVLADYKFKFSKIKLQRFGEISCI